MKNETNTFIIMRDNELDKDFHRKQQIEAVQRGLGQAVATITTPVHRALHNVRLNVQEAIEVKAYDIIHGTDFTTQLQAQREAREHDRAAERFGLQ